MIRRMTMALCTTLALMTTSCVGRPGFIPTTRHIYERFTPLAEPRPDVPVGALWIDGYGATGDGAATDNQETVRSLSGFTFDADFQASLTLGVLKFLDLDPSLRKKVVARFNDLSIIRVRDWSKLTGPTGEPRIYEALKAGTISITTTGSGGLDIESHALSQSTPVIGRGATGITRTFVIDGKDLVFAIHVASYRPIATKPIVVMVSPKRSGTVALGRYDITLSMAGSAEAGKAAPCAPQITYRLMSSGQQDTGQSGTIAMAAKGGEQVIDVPVPQQGLGGLLTGVRLSWDAARDGDCEARSIRAQQTGYATIRMPHPDAEGW
jgi:hypothetical protein